MAEGQRFKVPSPLLPAWLRQEVPDMRQVGAMKELLRGCSLNTVCEQARCPNMGTCFKSGVATFMILGSTCTRACRFCAVLTGPGEKVDANEPEHVALAVRQLGLRYVVVTSVTRDDLEDQGAGQFALTIKAIRNLNPSIKIEVLTPDFSAKEELLKIVSDAKPEVFGHNIETVRRTSVGVRPQASYERSVKVLRCFRSLNRDVFIKSSLMVGLGERDEEVLEAMEELVHAGCQILTIGQYLAPSQNTRHWPVERYVSPETFEMFRQRGLEMGFKYVESAPLVRSSYIAEKGYQALQGFVNI
ncbi:MAG: lipoyl synthase [Candidatus Omnitrophica bacterium]|nr:lipoyl synthase [Candidatus Omnitrophota bacterium]